MTLTFRILATILFLIFRSAAQRTALEQFLPEFRSAKDFLLRVHSSNLSLANDLHKLQPRIREDIPFPCNVKNARSLKRPMNVHRLKPGDIDIIGALGDSLTAGNGLLATDIFQVFLENRGISFSIGGQGTWREYVTLPNILKEFNPGLFGFSTQDTFAHHKEVAFNAAEPIAMSHDMPYMANILINRIKDDSRVKINEHWKMITILIGPNDFCSNMCYHKDLESIVEAHRKDLFNSLKLLRDNLPHTLVNLILSPNMVAATNITLSNRPPLCYFTHNFECSCIFGLQFAHLQNKFYSIINKWQQVQVEVANSPEFDRDNFTVVVQPFSKNYLPPKDASGLTDYSAFSEDCVHFSQKENARTTSLWNNILEPVGRKSTKASQLFNFKCPSKKYPFIFTKGNSKILV